MTMLIIQSLLLVAIAYVLGCIVGSLLKLWFGTAERKSVVPADSYKASPAPVSAVTDAPARLPPPPPPPPLSPVPARAMHSVTTAAPAARASGKKKAGAAKPVAGKKRDSLAEKPKPASQEAAKPVPSKPSRKDDLKQIKGIGRQNEARLNAMGVTEFAQISAWTKRDQAEWGERLAFPGRIEREEWVKQARLLAKGGATEFSRRVTKGEVQSSMGKGTVGDLGTKPPVLKAARGGRRDNLTLIDGVGNAIEKKLFALGIFHFDQIAKWTDAEATWIGNELGFPGRPERENWVREAGVLAAGGTTEHSRRVESGEVATSHKSKPGSK
jgi:predicted flap endonuclease-1-like 5' DNA nuclease